MTRREQSIVLDEEIDWLRSYRMSNEQIARQLGVTVDTVELRARRHATDEREQVAS